MKAEDALRLAVDELIVLATKFEVLAKELRAGSIESATIAAMLRLDAAELRALADRVILSESSS